LPSSCPLVENRPKCESGDARFGRGGSSGTINANFDRFLLRGTRGVALNPVLIAAFADLWRTPALSLLESLDLVTDESDGVEESNAVRGSVMLSSVNHKLLVLVGALYSGIIRDWRQT